MEVEKAMEWIKDEVGSLSTQYLSHESQYIQMGHYKSTTPQQQVAPTKPYSDAACIMLRLIDSDNPIDEVKSVEEEFRQYLDTGKVHPDMKALLYWQVCPYFLWSTKKY
jgi:hypothetical protein